MSLAGIDPSFTRTGISVYHNNRVHIISRSIEMEKKDFSECVE